MKKNFTLLSLALVAAGFSARADHSIYIANQTGWDEIALYAWGDAEVFGTWPGATAYTNVTVNDIEYARFTIAGNEGASINPILNNNDNGLQIDLPNVTLDKDYYFATNGSYVVKVDPDNPVIEYPSPATLYILDETGWDKINVYAWASNQADLFGGWPGAALTETATIDNVEYKTIAIPGNGISYNLIFTNSDESQRVEGISITTGADACIRLTATEASAIPTPGVEYYYIYVEDKTGWENLYIYAYYDGAPSIFGGWPGAKGVETEEIEGKTYYKFAAKATADGQSLIFHNGNGTQYDVEGIFPIDRDYYFIAEATGASSGVDTIAADNSLDAPVEYFNLQGIRVANPENGLYIRRQGSKIEKVLVK